MVNEAPSRSHIYDPSPPQIVPILIARRSVSRSAFMRINADAPDPAPPKFRLAASRDSSSAASRTSADRPLRPSRFEEDIFPEEGRAR
jgi:hypothetical protein